MSNESTRERPNCWRVKARGSVQNLKCVGIGCFFDQVISTVVPKLEKVGHHCSFSILGSHILAYLEKGSKHMECVDSTGAISIRQQLAEVSAPGLLCILTNCWLKCCQDGREEGRRRWGRAWFQPILPLLLSLVTLLHTTPGMQRGLSTSACTPKDNSMKSRRAQSHSSLLTFL